MVQYTNDQANGLEKLQAFIENPNPEKPFFVLKGSAGTGKTFSMAKVPGMCGVNQCVGTAPTHKAVGVLSERMEGQEVMTIHSFLGLKPVKGKGEDGPVSKLQQRRNFDPSAYAGFKVALMDEGSMGSTELKTFVEEDIKTTRRKYVIVGDPYQLYPVEERHSPFFHMGLPESQEAELFEIVRQAKDSPIIQIATNIREAIKNKVEPPIRGGRGEDGSGVFILERKDWERKLNACVEHPEFHDDPDFCRIISYRNAKVFEYNQLVRKMLKEDLGVPFTVGDYLVVNEAWVVDDEVVMTTGEEYEVNGVKPHTHPVYPELKGWQVMLDGFTDRPVFTMDWANDYDLYKKVLRQASDDAKKAKITWRQYYALQEYFVDLRPLYSLTAHKSQGSTFRNVFMDLRDIYSQRSKGEADRCYYVALTRASKNVFVLT